jgi:hypothetical protein
MGIYDIRLLVIVFLSSLQQAAITKPTVSEASSEKLGERHSNVYAKMFVERWQCDI